MLNNGVLEILSPFLPFPIFIVHYAHSISEPIYLNSTLPSYLAPTFLELSAKKNHYWSRDGFCCYFNFSDLLVRQKRIIKCVKCAYSGICEQILFSQLKYTERTRARQEAAILKKRKKRKKQSRSFQM